MTLRTETSQVREQALQITPGTQNIKSPQISFGDWWDRGETPSPESARAHWTPPP